MRVAVISDIHGNGPALDAVLADIDRRGVDAVYCLGDVCLQGPHAAECVDRLRQRNIPTVRGNTDRYLAHGGQVPNLSATESRSFLEAWRAVLGEERLRWLGNLPERMEVDWEGVPVLLVHGSPRSDEEPLLPSLAEPAAAAGGPAVGDRAAAILFGHHHLQLAWRQDGRWMIGPGSVGMPFDGDPRAAYALIEVEARGTEGPTGQRWEVRLVRVPYDVEATLAAHRQGGWLRHNPLYPHQLRQGRQRPEGGP